jgi:hypothetical protein
MGTSTLAADDFVSQFYDHNSNAQHEESTTNRRCHLKMNNQKNSQNELCALQLMRKEWMNE